MSSSTTGGPTDETAPGGPVDPNGHAAALAVVGMAGRFPGAASPEELWRALAEGRSGLRQLTDEELAAAGIPPAQLADPSYVRIGGPVADLDLFDAGVFGMSAREAMTTDPQHRIFLECAWEALESAGYCPTATTGQVGVFAGCGFPDYLARNMLSTMSEPGGALLVAVGNERDSLASLVSYKFGLRGPALGVQTFCSTSLVAVHLACQSLLTFECDMALAGGVFVPLPQPSGYLHEPGGILSPDGVVRSLDVRANGTVMGSGAGIVVLKRLTEAVRDGDLVRAVILASAVNNDGRTRAGYTAPGVDGETEAIELALGVAGVPSSTVGYVECHATGTLLGDSIELSALTRAFAEPREDPCVLGTVKPSIGHLDRAAGVTGLIRATMCLEQGVLPATPGYEVPNPALAGKADRFTVLTEPRPWPVGSQPRRAGVNSFGLGGTNAHVVLEEAPARPTGPARPGPHLLTLSALDERALDDLALRLREYLLARPGLDVADIAYTMQSSRTGFALRRAAVVRDLADAAAALADRDRWAQGRASRRDPLLRLNAPSGAPAPALAALEDWLGDHGVRLAPDGGAAEEIVVDPVPDGPDAGWRLAMLARAWLAGACVDWGALHQGKGRRLELPTYPFQRRRYWVEAQPTALATPLAGRNHDRSTWTYLPSWRPRPLSVADLGERARAAGPWLVLAAEPRGLALAAQVRALGAELALAVPGDEFSYRGPGEFTLRPSSADDMIAVIRGMPSRPRTVVHAFSLGTTQADDDFVTFTRAQDDGVHSVLALARALVDDTGEASRVELTLLTSGAVHVAGDDLSRPEHAGVGALAATLAQENPAVRARHVDLDGDLGVGARQDTGVTARTAVAGILAEHRGPLAIRSAEPWQRAYDPYPLTAVPPDCPVLRPGETVLITGGLGDVGLTLARRLAALGCRLVCTVRTELPPRPEWPAYLRSVPPAGLRAARHVRSVLELEDAGAEVLALTADVSDVEQMREVVRRARERFGRIDLVVHAAGVQDPRFFDFAHLADPGSYEAHAAAKVGGFHVLQEVLGDDAHDRRVSTSSLATVLGGMTLGPYAAANAALDAYVEQARVRGIGTWTSVDWDTWRVDPSRSDPHSPDVGDYAMAPVEAVDVFERTLRAGADATRLVVSTGALERRVQQWVIDDLHAFDESSAGERHPRPELDTPFVEPRPGTEALLAEVWSTVLAVEPIGTADNFFELGGHSLIAIELTHRIRRATGRPVPVTALLESPTVARLAAVIDTADAESSTAPEKEVART
ncbi:MAG: SDR family NAD(P)-dependent oxidoreductase [Kineosporiaceae bacterium]